MKKIIFCLLCIASGVVFSLCDSLSRGLFLSLPLCVLLPLFGGVPFVSVCCVIGLLRDFLNYSLPFYAFIYLYISVGCVWIKGFLFKTNFLICFAFWLVSIIFACLLSNQFSLLGFVLNALSFLVFYVIIKGAKIEKNNTI